MEREDVIPFSKFWTVQVKENKNSNGSKLKSLITCGLGDYLRNMIKLIVPQKSNENVTSNINEIEAQNLNDDNTLGQEHYNNGGRRYCLGIANTDL